MTTPIAGVRVVVDTREGVRSLQELQRAAQATPAALREAATRSAAAYTPVVQQIQRTTAATSAMQQAAVAAGQGIGRLREPLTAVAASAVGASGPITSVVSLLGSFAVGSPVMVGILTGVAAVGTAMRLLGEDARAGEAALKDLQDRAQQLRDAAREKSGETLAVDLDLARALFEQQKQLVDSLTSKAINQQAFFGDVPEATKKALGEASAQLEAYRKDYQAFQDERERRDKEAAEARERALDAENRKRQAILDKMAAEAKAEEERLQRIQTAALAVVNAFRTGRLETTPTVVGAPVNVRDPRIRSQYGLDAGGLTLQGSGIETLDRDLQRFRDTTGQTRAVVQATGEALEDTTEAERQRARALAEVAGAFADLGVQVGLVDQESRRFITGLLALGDAVAAGSPGGIAVAVAGLASDLVGLGGAAAEAARDLAESRRQYELAVEAFANPGGSSLQQALRGISDEFDRLVRDAARLSGFDTRGKSLADLESEAGTPRPRRGTESREFLAELDRLRAIRAQLEEEAREQAAASLQRVRDDLEVRRLLATGDTAGAEALRRRLEGERELADLQAQFGDLFTDQIRAEWERVRALEAEAEAVRQATEEAQKRADVASALTIRELTARGALGQDVAAELRAAQNAAELEAKRREGYTAAELERVQYLQGLEAEAEALAATQAAAEQAAREAQEAAEAMRRAEEELARERERQIELLRQETRAQEDLNARKLRAQGLDAAADELALIARQRQEVEDARGQGFSAALIADLVATQRLERERFAADRAARQQAEFDRVASSNFGLTAPTFGANSGRVDLAVGVSESTVNRLAGLHVSQLAVQSRYLPFLEHLASVAADLAALKTLLARQAGLSPDQLDQILGAVVLRSGQAQGLAPSN